MEPPASSWPVEPPAPLAPSPSGTAPIGAAPIGAAPIGAAQIGTAPYRSGPAPRAARASRPALPYRAKELLAALAVVAAIDVGLWSRDGFSPGGLGLATLFATIPIVLALSAARRRASARLAIVSALLAAVVVRTAIEPTVLTTLSGLALMVPFALALRARRAFVPEAIATSLATLVMTPVRALAAISGARALAARTRLGRLDVLPIALPALLCAVFAGVFALANPIVAGWLSWALDALLGIAMPPLGRVVGWGASLLVGVALVRPALQLARGSEAAPRDTEASERSVALARNVLVSLNVLFVLYHLLDAAYLWSGRPPEGMTTQRYAHAGAFWLTVALAMLTAVVGVTFRGALAHDARARSVRLLAYAWLAQGIVLAIGTYRRIAIHVAHTGLSNLRIVGILGTTLVVIGVILVGIKLHRTRTTRWMIRRQLDAFAITVVLFAVAPTHWLSARVNVSRILAGEQGPLLHLGPLSRETESVAELVPLLEHPDVRVRQGVAALIELERPRVAADVERAASWRARDLASPRALAAIDAAMPRIAAELGTVDRMLAREALVELADAAAFDRPAWERAAIPDARSREGTSRGSEPRQSW